jgi:hypothetical protein
MQSPTQPARLGDVPDHRLLDQKSGARAARRSGEIALGKVVKGPLREAACA